MKTMRPLHTNLASLLCAATMLGATTASADVVLSNFGGPGPFGIISFKGPQGIIPYQEAGFLLEIGSGSDYILNSIKLSFNSAVNTATPAEISLWEGGSQTNPQGTFLTSLSGPTSPSATEGTYTPDTPVYVDENSALFLRFIVPTGTGFYRIDSTTDPFTANDWSLTESYLRSSTGSWTAISGTAPRIEVNATAVPEPGSALLLSVSLAPLALRRRRTR